MDFIVKGHIIKYDVGRVTIDYEREQDIPEDKKNTHLRYNLINSGFGLIAKANYRAIRYKGSCCNPYALATIVELYKHTHEHFSIYVDENLVEDNITPLMFGGNNTKFGGAGIIMNPFSVSNDGLLDLFVTTSKFKSGIRALTTFEDEAKKYKGVHGYNPHINFYRGKIIRVVNNNYVKEKKSKKGSICGNKSSKK